MNSALQALFHTASLRDCIAQHHSHPQRRSCTGCLLKLLEEDSHSPKRIVPSTAGFKQFLKKGGMVWNKQQDSSDLLALLLNDVSDISEDRNRWAQACGIRQTSLVHSIPSCECARASHTTRRFEEFYLQVSVPNQDQSDLAHFLGSMKIDDMDIRRCEHCQYKIETRIENTFLLHGTCLIICFKRTAFDKEKKTQNKLLSYIPSPSSLEFGNSILNLCAIVQHLG